MWCEKCGSQNKEGAVFCTNCGNQFQLGESVPTVEENVPAKGISKKTLIAIGGVALAGVVFGAVVLIIILAILLSGGGYKKPVKNYFKAIEQANAEKYMDCLMPKDIQNEYFEYWEEEYGVDKEEWLESIGDDLEDDYSDVDFEWSIEKAEKLDKLDRLEDEMEEEYEINDLDDFRDFMEDYWYEEFGDDFDADKIKQAYAVEVKIRAEYDDGDRDSERLLNIIYKYKGKWYLLEAFD